MDTATQFKGWTRLFVFNIAVVPLRKYESIYSPSRYVQIVGQTDSLAFVCQPIEENDNTELRFDKLYFTIDLLLHSAHAEELMNIYIVIFTALHQ